MAMSPCIVHPNRPRKNGYVYLYGLGYAHRVAYARVHGPIPPGLQVDHLCRTRACINPDHLEAVTGRVNTLRGCTITARNAKKSICAQGHPLQASNVRHWKGERICRTCQRLATARYRRRRNAA